MRNLPVVGIVAPGRPLDELEVRRIEEGLIKWGFKVKTAKNLFNKRGYLADTDEVRAREFMNLWVDEEVEMIWCLAGGYGATRILHLLDFNLIKAHPKSMMGFSDITALHCALHKKCSFTSFLGPNLSWLFQSNSKYTVDELFKVLSREKTDVVVYPQGYSLIKGVITRGKARGVLVGGNLTLITSLIGTEWELETDGKILLLEDVNEEPYRIDRMLCQLRASGAFKHVKGVILASFAKCSPEDPTKSLTLEEVFHDYFSKAHYPVGYGFPSGHIHDMTTLVMGAEYQLEVAEAIHLKITKP